MKCFIKARAFYMARLSKEITSLSLLSLKASMEN